MKKIVQATFFNGNLDQVVAGVSDYGAYPKYVAGVNEITFVDPVDPAASCAVRYDIKVIKTLHYTLDMYHTDTQISWQMRSSNLLSHNSGCWSFSSLGDYRTKAVYELDIGFKIFVPPRIVKKLTESSLPMMFRGIQELIDQHTK